MTARALCLSLALSACASDGPPREATLDLELTRQVHVRFERAAGAWRARVTPSEGFGVLPPGVALEGPARVSPLPEAGAVLYSATFEVAPQPSGPCGDQPLSLALALHGEDDSDYVGGGITPYCGAERWHGVPAREPLRISGQWPARLRPTAP